MDYSQFVSYLQLRKNFSYLRAFIVGLVILQLSFPPLAYAPDPVADPSGLTTNNDSVKASPRLTALIEGSTQVAADPEDLTEQYLRIYERPSVLNRVW